MFRRHHASAKETEAFPGPVLKTCGRTHPDTSFTISRTNAVRLLKCPLVRDMRDDSRGLVFWSSKSVSSHALKPDMRRYIMGD